MTLVDTAPGSEDYVRGLCKAYGCSYESFLEIFHLEVQMVDHSNDFHFAGIAQSRIATVILFDKAKFLDQIKSRAAHGCPECHTQVGILLRYNESFAVLKCHNAQCGWEENVPWLASITSK